MALKYQTGKRTYFGEPASQYKQLLPDGSLETAPFLTAASLIPPLFDILGPTVFLMIKKDIQGNIDKLNAKYMTNPELFTTINAILEEEFETKSSTNGQVGALWLKRGLAFIQEFLMLVLEGGKQDRSENIQQYLLKAYEKDLKQHHSWVLRQIIMQLTKACPTRTTFIDQLKMDKEASDEEVYNDLQTHLELMKPNVEQLDKILREFKVETTEPLS
ncbi:glycolipid transfer protein-like [Gigantopelta aegis]|uniref:glycolipid transfer protein-like n=1 Tax=Gigantopelta aegis TaxID=1735272 RepID=UPI001B88C421|nr:glycolipid transfer protein-like [Gigantopelta aegis]